MTSTSPASNAVVESVDCIQINSTSTPLRAKIPCSCAIQRGTSDEPMKSVLTRSFSRSWLCATGEQNRTNKTNGTHAMAIFLAVNGFAPSRLYFFRAPQRAATLSRQLQQHCLPLSDGRSRVEFGADLLRADGQLAFQGVAHEYQRIDFALQDVTCRGYGLGDDIDILRPNDDDDLLAGSKTVR